MKVWLIHLKLESPLLLAGVANGDENSGRSLRYIPGASLRGALIAQYQAGDSIDLLADPIASKLFFSGDVRYLNGYPALGDMRTLPTPASWRRAKEHEEKANLEITDFALAHNPEKETRLGKAFITLPNSEENKFVAYNPKTELHLHIGGEGRGVVKQGQNTVFQYEAISAGQTFIAAILVADKVDPQPLLKLLQPGKNIQLGRSRSAEYGQVSIVNVIPIEGSTWQEAPSRNSNGSVVLTLLSDTLLRDANGQPTLDFDASLSGTLGSQVQHTQAFILPALVGGFNRKWGLPLPQSPAIGMGSVFVYAADAFPAGNLSSILENGVGEQTIDGFGRLGINWPGYDNLTQIDPPNTNPVTPPNLCANSKKVAGRMADHLLRRKLDSLLLEKSAGLTISGSIPNHQLGRLRSVVRHALDLQDEPLKPVQEFMNEKHLKPTAQKQFKAARVKGKRLYYWVEDLAGEKEDAFSKDYLDFTDAQLPLVAGEKAEITQQLHREYTLRLIEAVINLKMKSNPGGKS
jgi:CRISPR-associated protein Csx10